MKIVRLELPDGWGPWRSSIGVGNILERTFERHYTLNKKGMPIPRKDGIGELEYDEFCAYKSLDSMKKWVDLDELARAIKICSLKVLLLSVKNPIIGKNQVAFKKENVIKKRDISYMFIKGERKKYKNTIKFETVDDGGDPHFGS